MAKWMGEKLSQSAAVLVPNLHRDDEAEPNGYPEPAKRNGEDRPGRAPRRAAGTDGRPTGVTGRIRVLASGMLSGLLAGAVALGVAELVAGITGPQGGPVVAVGGAAIDMTPVPVKDFAIAHFGSRDKTALIAGILVLLAVFAAVIGVLALRWLAAGWPGSRYSARWASAPR